MSEGALGTGYAVDARVRSIATCPDGLMLLGTIEGSGSETYQTIIEARPHPKGRSHLWSGRCSCPVGEGCKHAVAVMIAFSELVADQPAVLGKRLRVALGSQLVQELRRSFNVGEEEGDGAGRKIVSHAA